MIDTRLKQHGTILIHNRKIHIAGFKADQCSCREVSALALIWAIGEMQRELTALIRSSNNTGNLFNDLPPELDALEIEI